MQSKKEEKSSIALLSENIDKFGPKLINYS